MWFALLFKTAYKYAIKGTVRRITNSFSFYYFVKHYGTFSDFFKNKETRKQVLKNVAHANALRSLGKLNYILDFKRLGIKQTFVRIGKGFTPMEVKKVYWFFKQMYLLDKYNNKKTKDKQRIENYKRKANQLLDLMSKLDKRQKFLNVDELNKRRVANSIDNILRTPDRSKDKEKLELKDRLKKELDIQFSVNSPETQNFSQGFHNYSLLTQNYNFPIRGWGGKKTKRYTYNVKWPIIKKALTTTNYGKKIFNKIRSKGRYKI